MTRPPSCATGCSCPVSDYLQAISRLRRDSECARAHSGRCSNPEGVRFAAASRRVPVIAPINSRRSRARRPRTLASTPSGARLERMTPPMRLVPRALRFSTYGRTTPRCASRIGSRPHRRRTSSCAVVSSTSTRPSARSTNAAYSAATWRNSPPPPSRQGGALRSARAALSLSPARAPPPSPSDRPCGLARKAVELGCRVESLDELAQLVAHLKRPGPAHAQPRRARGRRCAEPAATSARSGDGSTSCCRARCKRCRDAGSVRIGEIRMRLRTQQRAADRAAEAH